MLISFQLYFLKYDFWEYMIFGVISWTIDILLIKVRIFKSENTFAHMWHIIVIISKLHTKFRFYFKSIFSPF